MKLKIRIDGKVRTFEGDKEFIDKVMIEHGLKDKPKKKTKKYKAIEEEKVTTMEEVFDELILEPKPEEDGEA